MPPILPFNMLLSRDNVFAEDITGQAVNYSVIGVVTRGPGFYHTIQRTRHAHVRHL